MQIKISDSFSYSRLLRYTLPSIAMLIFTSVYSVVDGFFVSNFAGKTAFSAVNLIMPFIMILATVGFMLGTGGTAIVAKNLGMGNKEKANSYFSLFVYTAFSVGVVFSVLGALFMRPIAIALGAEGNLLEDCVLYGRISLISMPFYIMQLLFQSFFSAAGKPQLGLGVSLASGVTNIILDAVLVILLPQEYKLAGAAIATVTSEIVGGSISFTYFIRKNDSNLRLGRTSFDGKAILKACTNGSSEFMSNVSMSIVGMLYNVQLLKYAGENGVAAYGVMMYVSMIFSAAFMGYSVGSAPIVSYNFGAENQKELKSVLKKGLTIIGIFGASMATFAQLLARPLGKIFVGYDEELLDITVSGFRIFALSFLFMGFAMFISSFFTALSDGLTSALISFLRTAVFQVAAVIILPMILGIEGIWLSIIVAEVMAVLFSVVFLIKKRKKFKY